MAILGGATALVIVLAILIVGVSQLVKVLIGGGGDWRENASRAGGGRIAPYANLAIVAAYVLFVFAVLAILVPAGEIQDRIALARVGRL